MFEFEGQLSKECIDFIYNKQKKLELLSISIVCIIFSIILLLLAFLLHPIVLIFFIIIAIMLAIPFLPSTKKAFLVRVPDRYIFDLDEGTLTSISNKTKYIDQIDDIEKLIDYGNFYHIKFKQIPDSYFVLQKDLITKVMIDSFEEYFRDKIYASKK